MLLGVGCVGGGAARRSEVSLAPSHPVHDAGARQGADAGSRGDAAQGVPAPAPSAASNEVASSTTVTDVTLDLPYPADARPRAASPLTAAAEDESLARWNVGGSDDPNYVSSRVSYHPGTRVVVDTRLAKHRPGNPLQVAPKHGLTLDRVQAQARSRGYWPFRLCFEAGQHDKKSSGGETRIAFTVGLRGKVSRAWLLDSKLGNASTPACLLRETSKLEFTPRPARPLALVASIRLWPGDADLPALPEPANATAGDFDPSAVRARVAAKSADLTACFTEARRTDPALWGRLALAAILEVDGTVHNVSEVESHFPNTTAVRCAEAVLAGVTFPSVNGKPFTLVLPIRLSPPTPPMAPALPGSQSNPSPEDAGSAPESD